VSKNIRALPSLLRLSLARDVPLSYTTGEVSLSTEVARRSVAFRQQLAEWTASGRVGAPVFGLPGVAVALGQCVGCGETLAEGRTWRCAVCVRAVEQTLGLSPLEEPAP
jgi:hypothetical protein